MTKDRRNNLVRTAVNWRPGMEHIAVFTGFGSIMLAVAAILAIFVMEIAASPGPHLKRQPRHEDVPEHTDQPWDISIKLIAFPNDREALLDTIEQRSHAAGGQTLARTGSQVTVITDQTSAKAMLTMARNAWTAPLGQEYLAWASGRKYSATPSGDADTVLQTRIVMPFTAHPATPPILKYVMPTAGIMHAMFYIICLIEHIRRKRVRAVR